MKVDNDVKRVLINDGIDDETLSKFHKYENISTISVNKLRKEFGNGSWAARIAYNEDFGGVIIQQLPGEGNRKHYHPNADENWVILDGEWEWWIEGQGVRKVTKNDIVVVPKGVWHQIKCVGKSPGVRYAVTVPDVDHVYDK
jgi:mannose-6-phosphate isomerase-like protein (cupin superfamily)